MADELDNIFDKDEEKVPNFVNEKKGGNLPEGFYKPKIEEASDKKKGYRAVIRFLENIKQDQTIGKAAIERYEHFINIPERKDLMGSIICGKNLPENECELCDIFFDLYKSRNATDQESSKCVKRSMKYYSYVMIVEDEQKPELEGKVMVFQYGPKIKDKITQEHTGELTGDPCNVFNLAEGKDFILSIKKQGGYTNYDSSQFKGEKTAVKIKTKNGMKETPTIENDKGKKVIDPQYRKKLLDYLLKRDIELESFEPQPWDEKTKEKVEKIKAHLKGTNKTQGNQAVEQSSQGKTYTESKEDDFFSDVEKESKPQSNVSEEDEFDNLFEDI